MKNSKLAPSLADPNKEGLIPESVTFSEKEKPGKSSLDKFTLLNNLNLAINMLKTLAKEREDELITKLVNLNVMAEVDENLRTKLKSKKKAELILKYLSKVQKGVFRFLDFYPNWKVELENAMEYLIAEIKYKLSKRQKIQQQIAKYRDIVNECKRLIPDIK